MTCKNDDDTNNTTTTKNAASTITTTTTTLLLIDVQKDFHPPHGSLAIPTAGEDAKRIVTILQDMTVDRVVVTLDSHHKLHIAHPYFWWDQNELYHPPPFTIIRHDDIVSGLWKPRKELSALSSWRTLLSPSSSIPQWMSDLIQENDDNDRIATIDLTKYVLEYTKRLEEKGRFHLCIWPEHCLIGTDGHAMVDNVRQALDEWSDRTGGTIEFIFKGQNLLTEMYSALEADVPVSKETSYNDDLLASLLESGKLLVCGQAMSHCVNYTLRDIVRKWPPSRRSDIYLITDCASAVPGFESDAETFVMDMKAIGVQTVTSTELLHELNKNN
jgi:nicotinamidase/pyrazinamidase